MITSKLCFLEKIVSEVKKAITISIKIDKLLTINKKRNMIIKGPAKNLNEKSYLIEYVRKSNLLSNFSYIFNISESMFGKIQISYCTLSVFHEQIILLLL